MTDMVMVDELAAGGYKIVVLTIRREEVLNSVNLAAVQELTGYLDKYQYDDTVACLVLRGSGEKAFCAGGDIRAIYHMLQQPQEQADEQVKEFFCAEYGLQYKVYKYPKPVLTWGNGIVMGGGLGLHQAGSHKVVTPKAKLAMPEIIIGLFPDSMASWFLQRMPAKVGLFLGLTGSQVTAREALLLNLADYVIEDSNYAAVLDKLTQVKWSNKAAQNHWLLSQLLATLNYSELPPSSNIEQHWQFIQHLLSRGSLTEIDKALRQLATADSWLQTAQNNYMKGSPLTAQVTWEMFQHSASKSLGWSLIQELNVAVNITQLGDFAEGVRALLIDKDKNPNWRYKQLGEVTPQVLEQVFANPFIGREHPFSHMQEKY